jgi:myo-inositol-1(or 4)-monophosphatase
LITVMANAAYKAAKRLIRDFGEVEHLQVSRKGPADFVSQADLKAEQTLRAELHRAHPSYGFLMEETGESGATKTRWVVDPLDGTSNFLHGIPHFCISIGVERDGEPVAGVVYDPTRDELFWAEKGRGAYLNDRRLRVSARKRLADALIGTGTPFLGHGDHRAFLAEIEFVMAEVAGIRRLGAAALDLAYVAAGRLDGFWESPLSPWDICAGIILIREAGGYVSEIGGGHDMMRSGSVLAANDHLHLPLGRILREAKAATKA